MTSNQLTKKSSQKSKIDPFETHAGRYEAWFENHAAAYQSELDAVDSLVPKFGSAVEIGVGTGRFSLPLGIKHGIEPARSAARIASSKGIEIVQAVGEDLPFASSIFDFALIVTTICFFSDALLSLKEVYRILKSGGCVLIGFIDKESILGRRYLHSRESPFYAEATFYSVKEISDLLTRAGFRNADYSQTVFNGDIENRQSPREGHGTGSFVVVRASKNPQILGE
ncbi:MAG: class I SAM-dependent methyltransferase [Nitrososphaerota archaeon]|nr:class I SAM-dependent methyltransferase [Nitrososphaerota archaeon]